MANEIKTKITLKLSHFEVRGVADVTAWGGGTGCIEMKPFKVASSTDKELLKAGLNDSGHGVKSINGGVCDVYAVYSDDDGATAKKFIETVTVGKVPDFTMEYYNQI